MAVWADAVDLVNRVSDRHLDEVRCHELARAAWAALMDLNLHKLGKANATLELVDGQLGAIEHSWLMYRWHDPIAPKQFILDVYCPGRMPQVQLIDTHVFIARNYDQGPARTDIKHEMTSMLLAEMQRGR
jgi:hypothetical protein